MQIILADAKLMEAPDTPCARTLPEYASQAETIAAELADMDVSALEKMLHCSRSIAADNLMRFRNFPHERKVPALYAFIGQAYKHLKAATLPEEAVEFAQNHLHITSFLYGLLRPMDGIAPYRSDPAITLEATGNVPLGKFWRDILTTPFIDGVNADEGVLIHLSTAEYEQLFDWNRVKKETKVIQPLFYIRKNGTMKIQAVWAKTCRGAMTRYILTNRITHAEDILGFEYGGFRHVAGLGDELFPHFVRDDD